MKKVTITDMDGMVEGHWTVDDEAAQEIGDIADTAAFFIEDEQKHGKGEGGQ